MGTRVVFNVSSPYNVEGDYSILWSTSSLFQEGTYTVITHGALPKGNQTASVPFSIPETPYGNYFVQFFQVTRDAVNDQFKVLPGIFPIPATVAPASSAVIKGNGFPAGDTGTVYLRNSSSSVQFTTNSAGSFSVTLPVPELASGNYTVAVSTGKLGTDAATANIQVVTQSGITLVNPQPTQPPQNNTNPGNSSSSNSGNNSITVGNGIAITPPQTPKAIPPKPAILSPREESIGTFGTQSVTFKWSPVPEPKGITYKLEVGDNFSFDPPLSALQKSKITTASYTLELEPGTYYWRVKAVDSAGNEGQWSYSPYHFKVSDFPIIPIAVGVIVMIALVFLIKGLTSRGRQQEDEGYYYYQ